MPGFGFMGRMEFGGETEPETRQSEDVLLLEDGSSLLLESGDYIVLETHPSYDFLLLENGSAVLLESASYIVLEG